MKFKVIVCDDEKILADMLGQKITYLWQSIKDDNSKFSNTDLEIVVFYSYEEIIQYLKDNKNKNEIYFLDIELKGKNGVELAEKIKQQNSNGQIIFVTSYDDYASLTYKRRIGAIDYINKNEKEEEINNRIITAVEDALENIEYENGKKIEYFEYKMGSRIFKVLKRDIYYIENSPVTRSDVNLVFKNGLSMFRGNITQLADENNFLTKVSQSILVNMNNVIEVDLKNRWLTFPDHNKITFARRKKKEIQSLTKLHKNDTELRK